MPTITGKDATVILPDGTEIPEVTKWMFEPSVAVPKHASNTTGGAKRAHCGNKDSKGSIEVKIDTAIGAPWGVGDEVTLVLRPDKNIAGSSITVGAIISASPTGGNIDGDEIVGVNYSFEGSGPWVGTGMYANL